jgi:transmembrane sensor
MQKNHSEHIDNEAREWFTLMQSGAVTELQQQQLKQWLSADAAHQQAYRQYEIIWQDLATLANSPEAKALKRSIKASWFEQVSVGFQNFVAQLFNKLRTGVNNLGTGARIHLALSISASIIFIGALFFIQRPEQVSIIQYATSIAETKEIKLADGSQITLGAKSEIKVWATASERHVDLINGQAFFVVAKNPQRPFFVNSGNTLVKVVGTRFDVRKGEDQTRVAVLEGIVNVSSTQKLAGKSTQIGPTQVILTAGQQVTHANNGNFDMVSDISSAELEAWRHGRLIYRRASLADVVADANRYYNGTISLSSKNLADLKVTAAISTNQIESLTDMLSKSLPIAVRREAGNHIIIAPRDDIESQTNSTK